MFWSYEDSDIELISGIDKITDFVHASQNDSKIVTTICAELILTIADLCSLICMDAGGTIVDRYVTGSIHSSFHTLSIHSTAIL